MKNYASRLHEKHFTGLKASSGAWRDILPVRQTEWKADGSLSSEQGLTLTVHEPFRGGLLEQRGGLVGVEAVTNPPNSMVFTRVLQWGQMQDHFRCTWTRQCEQELNFPRRSLKKRLQTIYVYFSLFDWFLASENCCFARGKHKKGQSVTRKTGAFRVLLGPGEDPEKLDQAKGHQ